MRTLLSAGQIIQDPALTSRHEIQHSQQIQFPERRTRQKWILFGRWCGPFPRIFLRVERVLGPTAVRVSLPNLSAARARMYGRAFPRREARRP
jgi:hypothetical protein